MARRFPSNPFVPPQYPNPARDLNRLLIGEAPGEEESKSGKPFVGGSGHVLNRLLRSAGVDREGLTVLNCIQCQPPGNVFPTDREARNYISKTEAEVSVKQCIRNHVLPILESRQWKRVDLIGSKALHLIGLKKESITDWRGSSIEIDTEKIKQACE